MSRVSKSYVIIPDDIDVKIVNQVVSVKSKHCELVYTINQAVDVKHVANKLIFLTRHGYANGLILTGTMHALLNSMMIGVTKGFTKKLQLVGIGYRASVKGKVISLSLGFSHFIEYNLPESVIAECPNQTEIVLKGPNKQIIGQVAADIRAYRRPEPYKGKGIRYAEEIVRIKETKKK